MSNKKNIVRVKKPINDSVDESSSIDDISSTSSYSKLLINDIVKVLVELVDERNKSIPILFTKIDDLNKTISEQQSQIKSLTDNILKQNQIISEQSSNIQNLIKVIDTLSTKSKVSSGKIGRPPKYTDEERAEKRREQLRTNSKNFRERNKSKKPQDNINDEQND